MNNFDSPYYFGAVEIVRSLYLSVDEKHQLLNTLMRDASDAEADKIDILRSEIREVTFAPEVEIECAPEFPNLTTHPLPEYATNEQPF